MRRRTFALGAVGGGLLAATGGVLAPALLWQMPWRLGIRPSQLHPVDVLPTLRFPLLVAAGDADRHTTASETRRLFAAAGAPDKSLWMVPGAAHVDLHAFDRAGYERRVLDMLQRRLAAQA